MMDVLTSVATYGGGILAAMLAVLFLTKSFLIIGRPNELVIFSGR